MHRCPVKDDRLLCDDFNAVSAKGASAGHDVLHPAQLQLYVVAIIHNGADHRHRAVSPGGSSGTIQSGDCARRSDEFAVSRSGGSETLFDGKNARNLRAMLSVVACRRQPGEPHR
jgi:hypothetical protein